MNPEIKISRFLSSSFNTLVSWLACSFSKVAERLANSPTNASLLDLIFNFTTLRQRRDETGPERTNCLTHEKKTTFNCFLLCPVRVYFRGCPCVCSNRRKRLTFILIGIVFLTVIFGNFLPSATTVSIRMGN